MSRFESSLNSLFMPFMFFMVDPPPASAPGRRARQQMGEGTQDPQVPDHFVTVSCKDGASRSTITEVMDDRCCRYVARQAPVVRGSRNIGVYQRERAVRRRVITCAVSLRAGWMSELLESAEFSNRRLQRIKRD